MKNKKNKKPKQKNVGSFLCVPNCLVVYCSTMKQNEVKSKNKTKKTPVWSCHVYCFIHHCCQYLLQFGEDIFEIIICVVIYYSDSSLRRSWSAGKQELWLTSIDWLISATWPKPDWLILMQMPDHQRYREIYSCFCIVLSSKPNKNLK